MNSLLFAVVKSYFQNQSVSLGQKDISFIQRSFFAPHSQNRSFSIKSEKNSWSQVFLASFYVEKNPINDIFASLLVVALII